MVDGADQLAIKGGPMTLYKRTIMLVLIVAMLVSAMTITAVAATSVTMKTIVNDKINFIQSYKEILAAHSA